MSPCTFKHPKLVCPSHTSRPLLLLWERNSWVQRSSWRKSPHLQLCTLSFTVTSSPPHKQNQMQLELPFSLRTHSLLWMNHQTSLRLRRPGVFVYLDSPVQELPECWPMILKIHFVYNQNTPWMTLILLLRMRVLQWWPLFSAHLQRRTLWTFVMHFCDPAYSACFVQDYHVMSLAHQLL